MDMTAANFAVDDASSNDRAFYVDVPSRTASVVITITDDGLVVDVYPASVINSTEGPVTSCWATTSELAPA